MRLQRDLDLVNSVGPCPYQGAGYGHGGPSLSRRTTTKIDLNCRRGHRQAGQLSGDRVGQLRRGVLALLGDLLGNRQVLGRGALQVGGEGGDRLVGGVGGGQTLFGLKRPREDRVQVRTVLADQTIQGGPAFVNCGKAFRVSIELPVRT